MAFPRNPACLDMCSKCYRERCAEEERAAANGKAAAAALNSSRMDIGKADGPVLPPPRPASPPAPEEPKAEAKPADEPADEVAVSSSAPGEGGEQQRPVQKNPGRCFVCNKRVGLTGFKCRCEYVFCSTHRCVLGVLLCLRQCLATIGTVTWSEGGKTRTMLCWALCGLVNNRLLPGSV